MRWAKLIVATLVVAAALQPLLGQTAQLQTGASDADKAKQLERARAALFDFSRLSALNRRPPDTQVLALRRLEAAQAGKDSDLCYTMRVYQFSHKDDEPPRMTGSTTCTPANRVGLKDAIVTQPAAK